MTTKIRVDDPKLLLALKRFCGVSVQLNTIWDLLVRDIEFVVALNVHLGAGEAQYQAAKDFKTVKLARLSEQEVREWKGRR